MDTEETLSSVGSPCALSFRAVWSKTGRGAQRRTYERVIDRREIGLPARPVRPDNRLIAPI